MIEKDILKLLKEQNYIDVETLNEVENLLDIIKEEESKELRKMQVATIGIYNAGKSTLLNSLVDKKVFEIGDVPTTKSLDKYETNDIIYLDTPGLNANDEDTSVAYDGYKNSDIFLFVSNIQSGGLNISESNYLKMLKKLIGNSELLIQNTIFVLTNKDQIDETEVDKVVTEYKSHIKDILETDVILFICDSITYETGKKRNSNELIEDSGILLIKDELAKKMKESVSNKRKERLSFKKKELENLLIKINSQLRSRLDDLNRLDSLEQDKKCLINEYQKEFNENIESLFKDIAKNRENIVNIIPHLSTGVSSKYYYNEKSKYDLKRKIRSNIESAYNKRDKALSEGISKFKDRYNKYLLCTNQNGNFYYSYINTINMYVSEYVKKISEYSIKLPPTILSKLEYNTTSTMKDIMKELEYDLSSDVIKYSEYYTVEDYIDRVDISENYAGESSFLMFNFTEYTYSASSYDGISELEKDINRSFEINCGFVVRSIQWQIEAFEKYLKEKLEEKKNIIDNVINNISFDDTSEKLKKLTDIIVSIDYYMMDLSK